MQITLTELRRTPAAALNHVRNGHEVTVTEDGVPMMRLVPAGRSSRFAELQAAGVIKPPREPRSIDEIRAYIEAAAAAKSA